MHKGKRVFIPRIIPTSPESEHQFTLRRRHFLVRLADCITINKGQSQSLKTVSISLPFPEAIFSQGQLYVALSKVTNPTGIKIMVFWNHNKSNSKVWVKNVVYRKVVNCINDNFPKENIDELCPQLDDTFPPN